MTGEETPAPKLFVHCVRVFAQMQDEANYEPISEGDQNSRIYTGFLTKTILKDLGLPAPYYTAVLKRLKKMGCIRQLSRGGGAAQSRWLLLKEPELVDFEAASGDRSDQTRLQVVESAMSGLEDRLARAETALGLRETGT